MIGRLHRAWQDPHGRAWLPYLSPADLIAISVDSYGASSGFGDPEFNLAGFHPWEEVLVDAMFAPGCTVLVAAAGAGREMIGLARKGYEVTGFDPAPALIEAGRRNLGAAGIDASLLQSRPGEVSALSGGFDAVLIGSGSYHHIPTRAARIAFVRSCTERLAPNGPLILGSVAQDPSGRAFEPVLKAQGLPEPGDRLLDSFGHWFIADELVAELAAAGLEEVRCHVTAGRPAYLASARKPG
ncbi:MAG: class I SAM-dependent methyltransferase [Sphingomicrobium sp.]